MKLVTNCTYCKKDIVIKSYAMARPELAKERGQEFIVDCDSCGNKYQIHVNDVRAKVSYSILVGAIILSLIVTYALYNYLGLIGTISIGIPILIWSQQKNTVKTFNSYITRR